MDGSVQSSNSGDDGQSSALDHALLESLFYNEMMMLNASSPSSSNLMAQHLHEATTGYARESQLPETTDANTIAEKEMLRDFGVTGTPMILQAPPAHRTDIGFAPGEDVANPIPVQSLSFANSETSQHAPAPLAPQRVGPNADPSSLSPSARAPLIQPKPMHYAESSTPTLSIEQPVSHERAKKLVDQFATLASRLGIELPKQVLQQLSTAAALNDPSVAAHTAETGLTTYTRSPSVSADQSYKIQTVPPPASNGTPQAVAVEKLRITAEQAIAAVTKKRSPGEEADHYDLHSSNSSDSKPLYSKRRKKPRLSDCESKLEQLKAENEVLKRHLQNVSDKAQKIEQGKVESAKQIRILHESNADPEELDKVVKELTDTYSDYGCQRQRELSFHLEQLSRLVVPTNFTKLGLWTLGHTSNSPKRNPIAGILQRELDITPQQGRKIVEQSEKIKALCDNLKECLALLAKLKSLCEQKTQLFHDRMAKCKEILTTKQTESVYSWTDCWLTGLTAVDS
eukprot:scaffold22610_cov115-Cylindrotheca_fusiformis.AAC.12